MPRSPSCAHCAASSAGRQTNELAREAFEVPQRATRAKRADRVKLLVWDGSGLTLIYKRLEEARFVWPRIADGVMRLSPGQLGALFEGLDWKRVHSRRVARPELAQ